MENITLKEYIGAIERMKILLGEVDDDTPYNSPEMVEFMEVMKTTEEYEDLHFKLQEPSLNERIRFYFEQRFKYGQSVFGDDWDEKLVFSDENDLQYLRNLVNKFDDTEWIWGDQINNEHLNKIEGLKVQKENELFEFNHPTEKIGTINQRISYLNPKEKLILEREFFKMNASIFLPQLVKTSQEFLKNLIDEITHAKDLFLQSHMAYLGFLGTIEYSKENSVYYGKILNIHDLVLYEADSKSQLGYSFCEAVEHHIQTDI